MSLDDLQAQLRGALDQQFAALKSQYEQSIAEARRHADAEAERQIAARLEAAQGEFAARLEQHVAAARADAERRIAEAMQRIGEAEQRAEHLQHQLAGHNQRATQAEERAAQLEQYATQAEYRASQAEQRANQAEEQASLASLQVAHAEEQATQAAQLAAQAQDRVSAAEQRAASVERQIGDTQGRVAAAEARATTAEQQLGEASRRSTEAEQRAAAAEQQLADLNRRIAEAEQRAAGAEHQSADAARRIADAEARATGAEKRLAEAERRAGDAERQAAEAAARQREEFEQQLQQQIEQQAAQAAASARRTAELEAESQRRRAQNELEAERQRSKEAVEAARAETQAEAEALRAELEAELAAARESATAAAPVPAAGRGSPAAAAAFDRVLAALREIDSAPSLSQTLQALLNHASDAAGRAAVFLINGDRLKAWKTAGIPDIDVQPVESSIGSKDLLARAIQAGHAVPSSAALPAPPFARLAPDRTGVAAPLIVGGRAVAVLYADSGADAPPPAAFEIVETLARHASAALALRTALRTLEVARGPIETGAVGTGGTVDPNGDDQAARRFARLLVSEIKLYNEGAVRVGRQQRDLLKRLREEIDRARRLYEERVSPAVDARHLYFQQELVQTLADGDPSLLGTA